VIVLQIEIDDRVFAIDFECQPNQRFIDPDTNDSVVARSPRFKPEDRLRDAAIQTGSAWDSGLPRFARNDGDFSSEISLQGFRRHLCLVEVKPG
jgi:hypothetical protein